MIHITHLIILSMMGKEKKVGNGDKKWSKEGRKEGRDLTGLSHYEKIIIHIYKMHC